MALDNYANLKASILNWTGRNDLSDITDDFIDIAESLMFSNPEGVNLRLRSMETRSTETLSVGSRFIGLPDNYLEQRRLKYNITDSDDVSIQYRVPDALNVKEDVGMPGYFTVTSQFEFDRPADQDYTLEIQFFQKVTPLSDSNTVNDVLTNYPHIYLYGCLSEAKKFAGELEDSEFYYSKFISSIAGANARDREGRYGPAPTVRQKRGVV